MNFYFIPGKRAAITWSEKCACTSLGHWCTNALDRKNIPGDKRLFLQREGYNFHLSQLPGLIEAGSVKTLIVTTRDPVSRMLSSYINKFVVYTGKAIDKYDSLEAFSRQFLEKIIEEKTHEIRKEKSGNKKETFINSEGHFGLSFRNFLRYISSNKDNPQALNSHFRPQITDTKSLHTILSAKELNVQLLQLRIENFQDDLKLVNSHLDLSYMPPKINVTTLPDSGWIKSDNPRLAKINSYSLIQRKELPTSTAAKEFIKRMPKLRAKFNEFFAKDYEMIQFLGSA